VEEPRAALDLLCQLLLEDRIAQHPCANHHHGEKRALNEIASHPKTGATGKFSIAIGLTPNPACRNEFRERAAAHCRLCRADARAPLRQRIAATTSLIKPSRAAGSIQRNTATISF